jgi:hypothetical protein
MDLFDNPVQKEKQLRKFKNLPLLFSPFENSTCSVDGFLRSVNFNEEDIIDYMVCEGNIVGMDCNFGHKVLESYVASKPEKKSNRGRKKKEKQKKMRKYQGDGSSFNSQITFTVLGTHIRKIPYIPDKHSLKSTKLGQGLEKVTKEYKIKVFRNGSITVPGILTEDMTDITQPLNDICKYLSKFLAEDIVPTLLFSVMRNYKCRLNSGKIDIRQLQKFCEQHFHHLLNTRLSDIIDFIINPAFDDTGISPLFEGWNEVLASNLLLSPITISFPEMNRFLRDSLNVKNLYIDFDKLVENINEFPLVQIYRNLQDFYNVITDAYYELENATYKKILRFLAKEHISQLGVFLKKSKDNLLSHIKYDPEKYPGFLIKIKTPNASNPDKQTTIKIFPSGKINIDGANSRDEAEFIYYWLNNIFYHNPELIYRGDFNYEDPDSEFSSDSEDD